MANKTPIDVVLENSVSANTQHITTTPIIPNGKEVTLNSFSGSCLGNDYVSIQWGSGASWTTIMASFGNFSFNIKRSFVGDGSKRFRIVRANTDLLSSRIIFVFASALVHDQGV